MKLRNLALFLAFTAVPALALAQTPPGPAVNPGGPMQTPAPQVRQMMREHMQAFRQFHQRAEQEWRATRERMLAALSTEHRLMVAHIVGNLAISPQPDLRVAAHQIDAILTPAERTAILADAQAARAQMRAQMDQMRAQMQQMRAQMQQMHPQWSHGQSGHSPSSMMHGRHGHHQLTAGEALLHSLIPGHPGTRMMFVMHGGPHR